jgi:Na+/proline symporter
MALSWIDWAFIAAYAVFTVVVGLALAKRAGRSLDEYFLSGRSLPWWLAGTSMVATTFAADTPLVVSGWVRDSGIWKNWLWWCFLATSMLGAFLFAPLWRRGGVMTKAELSELRYGGREAALLRGFLGVMHAGFTNTITLCWVLLAAAKIVDVLFGVDKGLALTLASLIALSYSLLAGFWGVVLTDAVQFVMAVVGAVVLAVIGWHAAGGLSGVEGVVSPALLEFVPRPGPGGPLAASFWTVPVTAFAVYVGVSWWATESADGNALVVQRVAAARDERHGSLSLVWYAIANYALRPWPWILVAIASLVVLPPLEVNAPFSGRVAALDAGSVTLVDDATGRQERLAFNGPAASEDWRALPSSDLELGNRVAAGETLAETDSERAYVVMMRRYLPVGLLGLVAASLFAAFMSTVDTHVNLAASFFVNDVYRRFLARDRNMKHYVLAARLTSAAVLAVAGLFAYSADSIADLFTFFLAFLSGVGPVYVLRWLWWRVRARTEIAAMLASAATTVVLTFLPVSWNLGPLSQDGALLHEGRILIVVAISLVAALATILLSPPPQPESLVPFYRRVRPVGWWGPVAALAGTRPASDTLWPRIIGGISGIALVLGSLFGTGHLLLGRLPLAAIAFAAGAAGVAGLTWSLSRLRRA